MTLEELREAFPHAGDRVYLNHAATSPLSTPVRKAIETRLAERQGPAIDDHPAFRRTMARTRERAASVLGARADQVAFTANTSDGLNLLAGGLDWEEGDRVAVPGCEFPANVYPFLLLEDRGVEVDFVPHREGCVTAERVAETITDRTRLLSVSWVQFLSGHRTDLAEIAALCRRRDVVFCVDAIQGLGALELDVDWAGVDFLAAGGHKWLMGTQGLGLVYVSDDLLERLRPVRAGWAHGPIDFEHLFEYRLRFHPDATRFEAGTPNELGVPALEAALDLYERAGPTRCEERVLELARRAVRGMIELGHAHYGPDAVRSGIVTFRHPEPEDLQAYLAEHAVAVAVRNGLLRVSPAYYNTPAEIDRLLDLVDAYDEAS